VEAGPAPAAPALPPPPPLAGLVRPPLVSVYKHMAGEVRPAAAGDAGGGGLARPPAAAPDRKRKNRWGPAVIPLAEPGASTDAGPRAESLAAAREPASLPPPPQRQQQQNGSGSAGDGPGAPGHREGLARGDDGRPDATAERRGLDAGRHSGARGGQGPDGGRRGGDGDRYGGDWESRGRDGERWEASSHRRRDDDRGWGGAGRSGGGPDRQTDRDRHGGGNDWRGTEEHRRGGHADRRGGQRGVTGGSGDQFASAASALEAAERIDAERGRARRRGSAWDAGGGGLPAAPRPGSGSVVQKAGSDFEKPAGVGPAAPPPAPPPAAPASPGSAVRRALAIAAEAVAKASRETDGASAGMAGGGARGPSAAAAQRQQPHQPAFNDAPPPPPQQQHGFVDRPPAPWGGWVARPAPLFGAAGPHGFRPEPMRRWRDGQHGAAAIKTKKHQYKFDLCAACPVFACRYASLLALVRHLRVHASALATCVPTLFHMSHVGHMCSTSVLHVHLRLHVHVY
jgi:hypothetical protein